MTILAIVQARMTSSRLPGKVLMDIEGMPMIGRQLERIKESERINEIVVATSVDTSDDELVAYIKSLGVNVQRGPLEDVLGRFIQVLDNYDFATVVRLTADCPLADPNVIDSTIEMFSETDYDYVSNGIERTFPRGLDVEVFKQKVIRKVAESDYRAMAREHVTYGIYTRPDLYTTGNYSQSPSFANLRWTVDTAEDLAFVRSVYKYFAPIHKIFHQDQVLKWLEENPKFAYFDIDDEA